MKIAILNFYSGFNERGGETFVHELARRLTSHHQLILFQAGPKQTADYGVAVIGKFKGNQWLSLLPTTHLLRRLFIDRHKRQELIFTLSLIRKLNRFRPDIVLPLNSGWQALICSLYCRLSGAKLVISGQSGPGWDDRWNLLVKPHLFVALTRSQLTWARQATIWRQKIVLIPNGVDLRQFSPRGSKMTLELEKPIIMMVAASTPDKRVEEGIRAVARLKSASLMLLGKGPLDQKINNLCYKLLGEKRFLHLSVPHKNIPAYYRSSDIFTLCSLSSEAFGIVYLEAMASGLGCVATDDASRREIIGQVGVFVKKPEDAGEYASALQLALNTNWKNLPLEQASRYNWDRIAEKYESVFQEI